MPLLCEGPAGRPILSAPLLAEIIAKSHAVAAFVEYVSARPTDGPTGAFSFGRCRRTLEGICAALGLPIAFLTPPSWKRLVGIAPARNGAKDAVRSEAIRRWPDCAAIFARVRDDGRAKAALIAVADLMRGGAK